MFLRWAHYLHHRKRFPNLDKGTVVSLLGQKRSRSVFLTSIGIVVLIVLFRASLLSLEGLVLNFYELNHREGISKGMDGRQRDIQSMLRQDTAGNGNR